jgi:hypothetical protein
MYLSEHHRWAVRLDQGQNNPNRRFACGGAKVDQTQVFCERTEAPLEAQKVGPQRRGTVQGLLRATRRGNKRDRSNAARVRINRNVIQLRNVISE